MRGEYDRGMHVSPAGNRSVRAALRQAINASVLVVAASVPPAFAERYAIDASASSAGFTVRLVAVVPLRGEFGAIHGWIDIDRVAGLGRVHAVLAADSLRMRDPGHTAWARSPEFFDAVRHPEIHFASEPVPLSTLRDGGRLRGRLRLRGIERVVTLSLEPETCTPERMAACAVGVRGRIRRSDFGMQARRATVADWVSLDIAIRTTDADHAETANAKATGPDPPQ